MLTLLHIYIHAFFLCDLDLNSALRAASTLWSKSDLHHILYKLCFLVAHAIMTFLAIRLRVGAHLAHGPLVSKWATPNGAQMVCLCACRTFCLNIWEGRETV